MIGGGDWAENRIVPDCVRAWAQNEFAQLRHPSATRPWQHVLEPLSGYLTLAMALKADAKLHGQPFNFGPATLKSHSVASLALHHLSWHAVGWKPKSAANYANCAN